MLAVPTPDQVLSDTLPYPFLSAPRRSEVAERMRTCRFSAEEVVAESGGEPGAVLFVASGSLKALDADGQVVSTISAGHAVGERAVLLDEPPAEKLVAGEPTVLYALAADDFLDLVDTEPVFAQALSVRLTVSQGIFQPYRRLWARILSLLARGEFLLSELVQEYRDLHPALHPHLHEASIDFGALGYAIARLPEDVTRTCFYFLVSEIPEQFSDPDTLLQPVATRARRRSGWCLMPGKLLILLRDGVTDVTDLLTCLCAYAVEARKIRRACSGRALLGLLRRRQQEPGSVSDARLASESGLSAEELAGLRAIWGPAIWNRLHDILLHHEDIAIECNMHTDGYDPSAAERWVREIRATAAGLVDLEDPLLEVHIISSNTHSVGNCLSPYVARRADEILAWGRVHRPEIAGQSTAERPWGARWACREDLVYTLMRWYTVDAERRAACIAEERAGGHYRLRTTAFTGIAVDLIAGHLVDPAHVDAGLRFERPSHPLLIVNLDYAFGQQAEEIMASLLFVFGRRTRSVSVLGKAGGLVGRRGDLLLPRATLLQTNDELYPVPNADLDAASLRQLAPESAVHEGPVLTVAGTLLQDRSLLHFYRRLWKCVGLEMEGSYFARRLISAIETGVVRPDVRSRFVYYTSDVPLQPEENLSTGMSAEEGVPPLYGITRAILSRIFNPVDDR